jgi:hypothetical protein
MVLKEGTIALPHGTADGPLTMRTHTTLQLAAAPPLHWSRPEWHHSPSTRRCRCTTANAYVYQLQDVVPTHAY